MSAIWNGIIVEVIHINETAGVSPGKSFTVQSMTQLKQSGLLSQAKTFRFETTSVKLLRARAEMLATCTMLQSRVSSPLVFTMDTALKLLCIDVPEEFNSPTPTIVVESSDSRRRVVGTNCIQWGYPMHVVEIDGITCTMPDTTWLIAARFVDLRTLVRIGDAMMRRSQEERWMDASDFAEACDELEKDVVSRKVRHPAGFQNCRHALWLMRRNTDSCAETDLRLALVSHGLPSPAVNHSVKLNDARNIARRFFLDLAYPQVRVAVEYDGRQHADAWERDQMRLRLLESQDWLRIGVTRRDLESPESRRAMAADVAERLSKRAHRQVRIHDAMSLPRVADAFRRAATKGRKT